MSRNSSPSFASRQVLQLVTIDLHIHTGDLTTLDAEHNRPVDHRPILSLDLPHKPLLAVQLDTTHRHTVWNTPHHVDNEPGDALRRHNRPTRSMTASTPIADKHRVGRKQSNKSSNVAGCNRNSERDADPVPFRRGGTMLASPFVLDTMTRTNCDLAARCFVLPDNLADRSERFPEHIREHQHHSFNRVKAFQQQEETKRDIISQRGRIDDGVVDACRIRRFEAVISRRLGQPRPNITIAFTPQHPKTVNGQPCHDSSQPGGGVDDRLVVRAVPAQPRFLHDIISVGNRRQASVRDAPEAPAFPLERIADCVAHRIADHIADRKTNRNIPPGGTRRIDL